MLYLNTNIYFPMLPSPIVKVHSRINSQSYQGNRVKLSCRLNNSSLLIRLLSFYLNLFYSKQNIQGHQNYLQCVHFANFDTYVILCNVDTQLVTRLFQLLKASACTEATEFAYSGSNNSHQFPLIFINSV